MVRLSLGRDKFVFQEEKPKGHDLSKQRKSRAEKQKTAEKRAESLLSGNRERAK